MHCSPTAHIPRDKNYNLVPQANGMQGNQVLELRCSEGVGIIGLLLDEKTNQSAWMTNLCIWITRITYVDGENMYINNKNHHNKDPQETIKFEDIYKLMVDETGSSMAQWYYTQNSVISTSIISLAL